MTILKDSLKQKDPRRIKKKVALAIQKLEMVVDIESCRKFLQSVGYIGGRNRSRDFTNQH
jgi:hypothetical protein